MTLGAALLIIVPMTLSAAAAPAQAVGFGLLQETETVKGVSYTATVTNGGTISGGKEAYVTLCGKDVNGPGSLSCMHYYVTRYANIRETYVVPLDNGTIRGESVTTQQSSKFTASSTAGTAPTSTGSGYSIIEKKEVTGSGSGTGLGFWYGTGKDSSGVNSPLYILSLPNNFANETAGHSLKTIFKSKAPDALWANAVTVANNIRDAVATEQKEAANTTWGLSFLGAQVCAAMVLGAFVAVPVAISAMIGSVAGDFFFANGAAAYRIDLTTSVDKATAKLKEMYPNG